MLRACPRCHGLLVSERLRVDRPSLITFSRCVSCGFYTDPVMASNRSRPPLLYDASTESSLACGASHPSSESGKVPRAQAVELTPAEALSIR